MRVGLKSGAPWKLTSACPKRLACGVGESSVTVCTQAGQPMPRLVSLGAKFTPRSWARPASEASSSTNQTVWPPALPWYSGRRTLSLVRSTWIALSSVSWSRGSSPLSCPSPLAAPGGSVELPSARVVVTAEAATTNVAASSNHRREKIFIGFPFPHRRSRRPERSWTVQSREGVVPLQPGYRLAAKRQSEALGPDPGRRHASGVRDARGVVLVGRTLALFSAPWGYDPGLRCGILVQLLRREATHVYNRRPRRLRPRGAHRRPHLRPLPRRLTRRHTRPVPGARAPDRWQVHLRPRRGTARVAAHPVRRPAGQRAPGAPPARARRFRERPPGQRPVRARQDAGVLGAQCPVVARGRRVPVLPRGGRDDLGAAGHARPRPAGHLRIQGQPPDAPISAGLPLRLRHRAVQRGAAPRHAEDPPEGAAWRDGVRQPLLHRAGRVPRPSPVMTKTPAKLDGENLELRAQLGRRSGTLPPGGGLSHRRRVALDGRVVPAGDGPAGGRAAATWPRVPRWGGGGAGQVLGLGVCPAQP